MGLPSQSEDFSVGTVAPSRREDKSSRPERSLKSAPPPNVAIANEAGRLVRYFGLSVVKVHLDFQDDSGMHAESNFLHETGLRAKVGTFLYSLSADRDRPLTRVDEYEEAAIAELASTAPAFVGAALK